MRDCKIVAIALCAAVAFAFPTEVVKRQLPISPPFDAEAQRISVTGIHKFVPPDFAKGDQRGPCPGLNALANHGYLPHSGVGTITDFTFATNKGKKMPSCRSSFSNL